jgi:hypothetical protein
MMKKHAPISSLLVVSGILFASAISSTASEASAVEVSFTSLLKTQQPIAITAAKSITVKGRAPKTGYSGNRTKLFGTAWHDVDRNGCDTRNDILRRDFYTTVIKAGTGGCKVIGGTWRDPYSNISYRFTTQPSSVQVDHIVSLSDAWQKGAQQWTFDKRRQFANDPLNLVMTIGSLNASKSDSDAASWLPPYKSYRCKFVARQVAVKKKYGLWMTSAERTKIIEILQQTSCRGLRLPTAGVRP